jgi:serine phosphatase RsbU (regulator of sigma subunit)
VAEIDDSRASSRLAGRRLPHGTSIAVLLVGAALTVSLAVVAASAHDDNEDRLLGQRVSEAAAVLTASLPSIETPVASAVAVVEVTDGADQDSFRRLMQPLVEQGGPYVSASLWRVDRPLDGPELVVGTEPKLVSQPDAVVREVLGRAVAADGLSVTGLLDGPDPRLGYAYTTAAGSIRYAAYVEQVLAPDRRSAPDPDSPFAGLDFAIYLGRRAVEPALLSASVDDPILSGRRADEVVPFGDTSLLLVMSPSGDLGGRTMAALPWLVALVGGITTIGAALLVERLLRRRDQAQALSDENASLYAAQRSLLQRLQRSLLPNRLPEVEGLESAATYLPGAAGLDIGGDWYDVIDVDARHVLVVAGDVSGRGIPAASLMATLRSSIRAFASEGRQPAEIFDRLTRLVDIERDGHFATVVCAALDLVTGDVTVANAGHPSPLLVTPKGVSLLEVPVGPPIGVVAKATYEQSAVRIEVGTTLLVFTDGLFERRGETVDEGFDRLRSTVHSERGSSAVGALIEAVVAEQIGHTQHDDAAILGVRWTSPATTSA